MPDIQQLIASQIANQGNPQVAMEGTPGASPSISPAPMAPMPDRSIQLRAAPTAAHRQLIKAGIPITPQLHAQIMQAQAAMQGGQPMQGQPMGQPIPQAPVAAPAPPQAMQQPNMPPSTPPVPTPAMGVPNVSAGQPPTISANPQKPPKVTEPEKAAHQQKFMEVLENMLGKIV